MSNFYKFDQHFLQDINKRPRRASLKLEKACSNNNKYLGIITNKKNIVTNLLAKQKLKFKNKTIYKLAQTWRSLNQLNPIQHSDLGVLEPSKL